MIVGRSHPENTHTQIVVDVEPGGGYILLTHAEYDRFALGEPVKKRSGDKDGYFTFVVQLVRDPKPELRCRYADCPEGHPLVDEEQVTCSTCRQTLGLPPLTEPSA